MGFFKSLLYGNDDGIKYIDSDVYGLAMKFFDDLQSFDTSLPDSNLFYVLFSLPKDLTDNLYRTIGETPKDKDIRLDETTKIFDENKIQALTIGVDIPNEANQAKIIPHSSSSNGFLPIAVNGDRVYNNTNLQTTFYDSNLSLSDLIFKPWIKLINRNGSFDNKLYTDVYIVFLGRNNSSSNGGFANFFSSSNPSIRKMYKFYDCIPIDSLAGDNYQYESNPRILSQRIQWKFNRHDCIIPK
jgi:hypothetical protein